VRAAMRETRPRRAIQIATTMEHGSPPTTVLKASRDVGDLRAIEDRARPTAPGANGPNAWTSPRSWIILSSRWKEEC